MSENSFIQNQETNKIRISQEFAEKKLITGKFNAVWVKGRLEHEFQYSHEVLSQKFYKTRVIARRLMGREDIIPIIVSEYLVKDFLTCSVKGKYVDISGQFRSHNQYEPNGNKHVDLFLFVTKIRFIEDEEESEILRDINMVYLEGNICKEPYFRTIKEKQISDLIIAVKRSYYLWDYIPCVALNSYAIQTADLKVGDKIQLYGKIQSRNYLKRTTDEDNVVEYKKAYEILICKMKSNI